MKKLLLLLVFAGFLTSCNVTESIVFNEDGSGQFLVTYEMGEAMKAMTEAMGGDASDDSEDSEMEEAKEVMDTMMVFSEIMETYKDSVAALPEEKQLALEAVKDMFMKMRVDEANGVMNFGVGLNFESIDDLKDINEKIKKAQSLNAQNDQVDMMKQGSPLGKFMGNDDNKVSYSYTKNGFSRATTQSVLEEEMMEELFDEANEEDQKMSEYFEEAYYNVKLTFPKAVKSISIENAEFSEDRKTLTYKTKWIDYIKNPLSMDVNVEFIDE